MKFSKTLIPTLKEVPADCEADNVSHILMTRAGLVKRMSNGLFVHLPVMNLVKQKVEAEIRRGMAEVDCCEVTFPVLVQKDVLTESGRWDIFGDEMFKLKDRHEKEMSLSPTNEEASCFIARNYIQSHNQLPFALYQMQKKYRDEIRPRGGVMRAREFLMKDAYSFHANKDCLDNYFDKMQSAYERIFTRLGIKFYCVKADNGAMGGSDSREFMVPSACGSDTIGVCEKCGCGANAEVLTMGSELCPDCKCEMKFMKAFEIGHIFKLEQHYTKKLDIKYVDNDNKQKLMTMGTYGIGVERVISAIIEQHNDRDGIAWPLQVAPFAVNIVTVSMADKEQEKISRKLYEELTQKGIEVLWDDRTGISVGVKFKDSDLIGVPYKIIVGKRVSEGKVEILARGTPVKVELDASTAAGEVAKIVNKKLSEAKRCY